MKNKKLDWIDFINGTKNTETRLITKKSLSWVKNKGRALDIGGGALNDSKFLLENGFTVDTVDSEDLSLDISKTIRNKNFTMHPMRIENFELGTNKYNLVLANYVLPFITPKELKKLIFKIFKSLKDGGVFCGTFFGKNDHYKNNSEIYFNTKKSVFKNLGFYEKLSFSEIEKKCLNYNKKLECYHSFEFIVRKDNSKFRKGAAAVVLNEKNQVLLVNLESFDAKSFTVPGGGQDNDEELLHTAYRELKEELNISKKDLTYVGECDTPLFFSFITPTIKKGIEYIGSEKYYFGFKFIGEDKSIIPNPGEVRLYEWVKINDLKDYLFFGSQLKDTLSMIKKIFNL